MSNHPRECNDSPYQLALLRPVERRLATKRHLFDAVKRVWTTEGYSRAKYFDHELSPELRSIFTVDEFMQDLAARPDVFIIRGTNISGSDKRIRRTSRSKHGAPASFKSHSEGRVILILDLDQVPLPDGFDPTSRDGLEKAIHWILETKLPKCFTNVSCAYQWSCSAGVERINRPAWASLNIHLTFMLNRPGYDAVLRDWLRSWRYIDQSLYNPVQPHYTASPVFVGGEDPLGNRRSGIIMGATDKVVLPSDILTSDEWHSKELTHKEQVVEKRRGIETHAQHASPARATIARTLYAKRARRRALDIIYQATEGSRHQTILREFCGLMGLVKGGWLNQDATIATAVKAARAILPSHRHDEIDEILVYAVDQSDVRDLGHIGDRSEPPYGR